MNYVYLQCDCRFNKWMLEEVGNKTLIEHTIEKCKQIGTGKIIAGVFDCEENKKLISLLNKGGVNVILSSENNVTNRFLDIVLKLSGDLIVRVGGEKALIDAEKINNILFSMNEDNSDWFYEEISESVLPDIVRIDCIRKYKDKIKNANRYFDVLHNSKQLKRYKLPYPLLLPFIFKAYSNSTFRVCKCILENNLDIYQISERYLKNITYKNSYLMRTGLLESWIIPVDKTGYYYDEDNTVNPWLGRTVIDVIKKHLNKTMNVFEWGMGNSTLFWSKYVNSVTSVEHDKEWFEKVKEIIPSNVCCKWIELKYGGDYCRAINAEDMLFDIIMIDGRDRVNCAKNVINKLTSEGIVIWDNTEREYYQEGFDFLKKHKFKQLELSSVLYGIPGEECFTSIFYRENNIFDL